MWMAWIVLWMHTFFIRILFTRIPRLREYLLLVFRFSELSRSWFRIPCTLRVCSDSAHPRQFRTCWFRFSVPILGPFRFRTSAAIPLFRKKKCPFRHAAPKIPLFRRSEIPCPPPLHYSPLPNCREGRNRLKLGGNFLWSWNNIIRKLPCDAHRQTTNWKTPLYTTII